MIAIVIEKKMITIMNDNQDCFRDLKEFANQEIKEQYDAVSFVEMCQRYKNNFIKFEFYRCQ